MSLDSQAAKFTEYFVASRLTAPPVEWPAQTVGIWRGGVPPSQNDQPATADQPLIFGAGVTTSDGTLTTTGAADSIIRTGYVTGSNAALEFDAFFTLVDAGPGTGDASLALCSVSAEDDLSSYIAITVSADAIGSRSLVLNAFDKGTPGGATSKLPANLGLSGVHNFRVRVNPVSRLVTLMHVPTRTVASLTLPTYAWTGRLQLSQGGAYRGLQGTTSNRTPRGAEKFLESRSLGMALVHRLTTSLEADDVGTILTGAFQYVPSGLPIINSFTASPNPATTGATVTLTWSVTGATALTIHSGTNTPTAVVPLTEGNTTRTSAQTLSYILTATNASGTVTNTLPVTVGATSTTEVRVAGVLKRAWNDHRIDPDFVIGNVINADIVTMYNRTVAVHNTALAAPRPTPALANTPKGCFKALHVAALSRSGNAHAFGIMDAFRATHSKVLTDAMYEILDTMKTFLEANQGGLYRVTVAAKNGYPQTTYRAFVNTNSARYWDWKEYGMCMAFIARFVRILRLNKAHDSRYNAICQYWDDFWLTDVERRWKHGQNKINYGGVNGNTATLWFPIDNITHPHVCAGNALWYRYLDARDNPTLTLSNMSTATLKSIAEGCYENVYKSCFRNTSVAKTLSSKAYPTYPAVVWTHFPMQPTDRKVSGQVGLYPQQTGCALYDGIKERVHPTWLTYDFGKRIHATTAFILIDTFKYQENRPDVMDGAWNPTTTYYTGVTAGKWKSMWGPAYERTLADNGGGARHNSLTGRQKGITQPDWDVTRLWDNATVNVDKLKFYGHESHDWNMNGISTDPKNVKMDSNWDPVGVEFGAGQFGAHTPFAPDVASSAPKTGYWYGKMDDKTSLVTQAAGCLLALSQAALSWDASTAVQEGL